MALACEGSICHSIKKKKEGLSGDHTFTVRATENHGIETVVFRGPPASHDARTRSHDGLCTATTAAIWELTEPIRKTAEAIPDSPRKNTEA